MFQISAEQKHDICKYSCIIVVAAALIGGLRAFGKNYVHQYFGDKNQTQFPYNDKERIIYAIQFIAGVLCALCMYYKYEKTGGI
jgi:hypothetical protein